MALLARRRDPRRARRPASPGCSTRTSQMGEEIDSLADAVNFGVAPAFIVYATLLSHLADRLDRRAAVRGVHRAAAGAVQRDARRRTSPPTPRSTSSACPLPPARSARSARWPPRCSSATAGGRRSPRSSIWMIGVSLLVVSRIPMRKIHTFSVPPNMVAPLLALLAIGVAAVDPLRLPGDPGDHRRPTSSTSRSPSAARRWLAAHPEVWDDKPTAAARGAAGDPPAPSRTAGRWRDSDCAGRRRLT